MQTIDAVIVLGCMALIVGVGLSCRGKQDSDRDYFTAQQGFRGWLGMALGGGVQEMSSYAADQMSLQRYLATGDSKSAGRALMLCFVSTAMVLLMLAAVGLALGTWYHLHPDPALPRDADRVFPYFVATQLPAGFVGMIVAALLAATMSSVTSGINALSGSLLTDFVPLKKRSSRGCCCGAPGRPAPDSVWSRPARRDSSSTWARYSTS
jgi:Na+/proline symporter